MFGVGIPFALLPLYKSLETGVLNDPAKAVLTNPSVKLNAKQTGNVIFIVDVSLLDNDCTGYTRNKLKRQPFRIAFSLEDEDSLPGESAPITAVHHPQAGQTGTYQ
jgi:hypothetical protein